MISVPVYNLAGAAQEPYPVDETRLGDVQLALLREAVQMYEMNQYVCTKNTKTRGEVSGSTRKLYRQKHTGQARAGNRTVPHRRGGGVNFAPRTRDMSYRLPRKALKRAASTALRCRLADGEVSLLAELVLDAPKTKPIAGFLKAVGATGRCLLVHSGDAATIWKSGRNIPGVVVRRAADLNAYDLMAPDRVVFTRAAFDAVLEALAS